MMIFLTSNIKGRKWAQKNIDALVVCGFDVIWFAATTTGKKSVNVFFFFQGTTTGFTPNAMESERFVVLGN
jgi:hypothetical protein